MARRRNFLNQAEALVYIESRMRRRGIWTKAKKHLKDFRLDAEIECYDFDEVFTYQFLISQWVTQTLIPRVEQSEVA